MCIDSAANINGMYGAKYLMCETENTTRISGNNIEIASMPDLVSNILINIKKENTWTNSKINKLVVTKIWSSDIALKPST